MAEMGHNGNADGIVPKDIFDKHKGAFLRHRDGEYAQAKALFDKAKKKQKNLLSEAKNDGLRIEQFKLHIKKHDLERESEGLGCEHVAVQEHYDRLGGLKPGEQGDLFADVPPGKEKDKLVYEQKGFDDVYYGRIDEGRLNSAGEPAPQQVWSGEKPSYIHQEDYELWNAGAMRAERQIQQEYLENQAKNKLAPTPVEEAADPDAAQKAADATAAEFPADAAEAPPAVPEKPKTQKQKDLEAAQAKAAELAAAGATNTVQ